MISREDYRDELLFVLHEIAASLKEIAIHGQQGAQSEHGQPTEVRTIGPIGTQSVQPAQPVRRSRPVILSVTDATFAKEYRSQAGQEVYEAVPGFRRS